MKNPVANARAALRKPKRTDLGKIAVTHSTVGVMQASSLWSGSPDLQVAAKRWQASADALEANSAVVRDLQAKLGVAQNDQRVLRRQWEVATQQVLATATTVAKGSNDSVRELGLDVQTRAASNVVAPEPVGIAAGVDSGTAVVSWVCPSARNGFVLQIARDKADSATYSDIIPCTRTKYTYEGTSARNPFWLRVAAIDPSSKDGKGPWSAWTGGTTR